ncbi:hypothetical protein FNV43_RR21189 [Rhamnella rubrinervis]|uniref:Uncharacterized protein n=1 Tax=Rhamnella rubrinervis TaxID=2594499 RepID=A0A8K0E7Z3_9ROSA|nr:hypothetical protein FNV43_RR21189 [Rhamnella rubrinervis]
MILRFSVSVEDGMGNTRHPTPLLISSQISCGFHVIPMVPTMTSLGAFLGVRYPRMLGYQFPNILHYNRLANDVFNKKQYIVNNELIPTEEELQKTYMINFWVRPDDKQYVGPPVVHVSAPSSAAPEPEPEQEPVYTTRASTQSQPEGAHSQIS